ncbi:MAG: hypothetical protein ACC657_14750 [Thiohalomonadales bacterium]
MKDQRQINIESNVGVIVFLIVVTASYFVIEKYIRNLDLDAAAMYILSFNAFSFVSIHLIKINIRKIIFIVGSSLYIGTLLYVLTLSHGRDFNRVLIAVGLSVLLSTIIYLFRIRNRNSIITKEVS